jgi:hypothetical protein
MIRQPHPSAQEVAMAFFEALAAIGLGRRAAKSLRKSELNLLCTRCTKRNGHETKTCHVMATDAEELEEVTRQRGGSVGVKAFGFVLQQTGLLEAMHHTDKSFVYKCTQCKNIKWVSKSKCF